MSASASPKTTTQIFEIYIKTTPEKIWAAITDTAWNGKYGYQGAQHYELKPGGKYVVPVPDHMKPFGIPDPMVDGEVLEVDPPRKLVQTYRHLFSEAQKAEGFTKLTWEITPTQSGFCRLSITHDVEGAPIMAASISSTFNEQGAGGWGWILSDLKSLLETGTVMGG